MTHDQKTHSEHSAKQGNAMPCTASDMTFEGRCLACGYDPATKESGDMNTEQRTEQQCPECGLTPKDERGNVSRCPYCGVPMGEFLPLSTPSPSHTPGPWEVDGRTVCAHPWGEDYPNQIVCRLESQLSPTGASANARLIAAAPELLEALRGIRDTLGIDAVAAARVGGIARAAIAKVERP